MKRLFLLFAVAAVVMTGCRKEETTNGGFETFDSVHIDFSPYRTEPMKSGSPISTVASRLDVYIIDGTDTTVWHQGSTDAGFGSLSVVMQMNRTYRLIAVAHNNTLEATMTDGVFSFSDSKIRQTLYADTTFSPADGLSLEVEMVRIVGMFKLCVADEIPSGVTHFEFTVDSSYTKWSTTGEARDRIRYVNTISGLSRGDDGFVTLNTYVMARDTATVENVRVTCRALDASEGVVEERVLEAVPIKDGYITRYAGTFFITWDMGFTFTVGDWGSLGDYSL